MLLCMSWMKRNPVGVLGNVNTGSVHVVHVSIVNTYIFMSRCYYLINYNSDDSSIQCVGVYIL